MSHSHKWECEEFIQIATFPAGIFPRILTNPDPKLLSAPPFLRSVRHGFPIAERFPEGTQVAFEASLSLVRSPVPTQSSEFSAVPSLGTQHLAWESPPDIPEKPSTSAPPPLPPPHSTCSESTPVEAQPRLLIPFSSGSPQPGLAGSPSPNSAFASRPLDPAAALFFRTLPRLSHHAAPPSPLADLRPTPSQKPAGTGAGRTAARTAAGVAALCSLPPPRAGV